VTLRDRANRIEHSTRILRPFHSVGLENLSNLRVRIERVNPIGLKPDPTVTLCITILEFNFTNFINFDFGDFNFANFINFDLAILNILIRDKLRSLFYNALVLARLNFNNLLTRYFLKSCAILFD